MQGLTVIIPYYQESLNIRETVQALVKAIDLASLNRYEILIISDGSTDITQGLLQKLRSFPNTVLVERPHEGRFLTRKAGAELAKYDSLLLCDSRVQVEENSLRFLSVAFQEGIAISPQNGWVTVPSETGIVGRFWEAASRFFWWRAFQTHINITLTESNYHQYPKGTGLFLCERKLFLDACENINSHFEDLARSSDDTLLLQYIMQQMGITLNYSMRGTYFPRTRFKNLFSNSYLRGYHAVDSFTHSISSFTLVVAIFALWPVVFFLLIHYISPLIVVYLILLSITLSGALFAIRRIPLKFYASVLFLLPVLIFPYTFGIYFGIILALRAKLKLGRES